MLPGFPCNFSARREINCQVIGYKGRALICILISELENEISIFLPWTDRHKSHCLQSLNIPHQIYRYWCRRERDHFLCHRNLKYKEGKKKKKICQLWSSRRNNMGWLHFNARSTITLLMKWYSPDFLLSFPVLSLSLFLISPSVFLLVVIPHNLTHFLFSLFHRLCFLKSHPVIMLFHGSGLEISSTYPHLIANLLDKSPNWNFSSPWCNKAPNNKDKQAVCFLWWSVWSQWRLIASKLTGEAPGPPQAAEWT